MEKNSLLLTIDSLQAQVCNNQIVTIVTLSVTLGNHSYPWFHSQSKLVFSSPPQLQSLFPNRPISHHNLTLIITISPQLHDSKKVYEEQIAVLREDMETRAAEHEVSTRQLGERVEHLSDQLRKSQGLLYDSKFMISYSIPHLTSLTFY